MIDRGTGRRAGLPAPRPALSATTRHAALQHELQLQPSGLTQHPRYSVALDPPAPGYRIVAMPARLALLLLLSCIASTVAARDAQLLSPDGGGCQIEQDDPVVAETAREADKRPDQPAAKARPPMRRDTGADASSVRPPRWHSFLPGMFR
jgi:hypothetical protein